MPISLDRIVEETREMPAEVVAEIESGKVEEVPLEESLARARKIAGL